MITQGYAAYKEAKVKTASAGDLVIMLFDAAINHVTLGIEAINATHAEEAHRRLVKAQEILSELMGSLNMEIELSRNLYSLYEYCARRLVEANIAKETGPAEEALGLLTELRETWQQAIRSERERTMASAANGTSVAHATNGATSAANGTSAASAASVPGASSVQSPVRYAQIEISG